MRMTTSYPKVSNRQRLIEAKATTIVLQETQMEHAKTMFLLLSALGQAGGEIKVQKGTMEQVRLETMGYEVVDGSLPNEKIIRLVTSGEDNAYLNDDNNGDENGGVEAAVETKVADGVAGVCGPQDADEGDSDGDGPPKIKYRYPKGGNGRSLPIP